LLLSQAEGKEDVGLKRRRIREKEGRREEEVR
jgi:hypothetical protein